MKIIKQIEDILKEGNIEEYKKEAQMIVCEVSGLSYEDIILEKPVKHLDKIVEIANKRSKEKMPIQYLLGYSYFMGDKYKVNKNVLIPRDETELLVNCAYELIKENIGKIDILDIGVGSGCISCALAKKLSEKNIEILGIDISSDAIITALENVDSLGLERKVILRKSDLFSKIRDFEKFDLIVSNPPYIPLDLKNKLQYEVSYFEPESALFAQDKDGIEFYKKIIDNAKKYLKPKGFISFEMGINQAQKIKEMLQKDFKDIEIIKDLAGIERVIYAKLK